MYSDFDSGPCLVGMAVYASWGETVRLTGQEREAAKLMYHLFDYGCYQLSKIFNVQPNSMKRIVRDKYEFPRGDKRIAGIEHDRQEVLSYIAQNGPVSCFDVELCCMMDKKAARRHLNTLGGQHKIERCYFGGEKFRVPA